MYVCRYVCVYVSSFIRKSLGMDVCACITYLRMYSCVHEYICRSMCKYMFLQRYHA